MFYSAQTGGFYDLAIHGDNIPANAVEITCEQHTALLEGQSQGKIIAADAKGFPVLQDPPKPTAADMWARIKAMRDHRTETGGFKVVVDGMVKWFHSDVQSRAKQLGLVIAGQNLPDGLQWKTMDGSFVTMTPALVQQGFMSAMQQEQATFAVAEQHRQAMQASAEPWAYDFSAGWPPIFGGKA